MTNTKQRALGCVLILIMFLSFPGCDTTHDDSAASGLSSVSFTVVWPDDGTAGEDQTEDLMLTAAETLSDDCAARGGSQVTIAVKSSSNAILKSGTFACSAKQGTLSGMSPQSGCTIVVSGKNASGNTVYQGEKIGVNLVAGANNAGTIRVEKVGSSITTPRITFKALPDTGQTESYTNTFGEDSDYTINPPSYTKLDDTGTALGDNALSWTMVRDNVTGLIWQAATANKMDWDAAMTYCENLTLGGYSDWRLPTVMELSTLVNAGSYNPAINTDFFPDSKSYCWSSSSSVYYTDYSYFVDLIQGSVYNYPNSNTINVRAVRGGK